MQSYNNNSENLAAIGEVSAYSLLKLNINQVELMSKCDLSMDDVRYVPMYEEYLQLLKDGAKKKQTIVYLAERYFLSESTVKRAIKRLSQRVTV